jgi:acetyl/propionyl-CoA carboxylase alpha subunit
MLLELEMMDSEIDYKLLTKPIDFDKDGVEILSGYAIEARVYAESRIRGFLHPLISDLRHRSLSKS